MPPAITMSRQRTPGCTCRATTHSRVPPPNQSSDASASPTTSQPPRRWVRAARNPSRSWPKNTRTTTTPRKEMTANSSRPRRSSRGVRARGMWGRKYRCRVSGARCREAHTTSPTPDPRHPAPISLKGYALVPRPRGHPQRTATQPQRDHRGAAAAGAHRGHRPVGVGQEHAGLRHAVCRRAATLHRVALDLRQAVPGADAQAAGGRDRGDLARGRDRAEESHHQQPVDRGDGHRDLRLPAVVVGADRHAVLREMRGGSEGGHGAGGGGRTENGVGAPEPNGGRLSEAVAPAFGEGGGVAVALENGDRRRFSAHPTCSRCGTAAPALTPSLFSFNNPRGACPGCNGFGAVLEYDESLIVPHPRKSLAQGALDPWTKPRYEGRRRILREPARARGIALDTAWRDLPERDRPFLRHGAGGRFLGMQIGRASCRERV